MASRRTAKIAPGTDNATAGERIAELTERGDRAGAFIWRKIRAALLDLSDIRFNSPLKKALLTGFHSTAKHNATKAVSPSSETMRTI